MQLTKILVVITALLVINYVNASPQTDSTKLSYHVIQGSVVLDRAAVKSIAFSKHDNSCCALDIKLTNSAAKRFHTLTANNLQKRMILTWGKQVISVTMIQGASGGDMTITGFTQQQADAIIKSLSNNNPSYESH